MSKIKSIIAKEILDSRSTPTIETKVELDDGAVGIASIPSGASTGSFESVELRDNDPKRYQGMGVLMAVNNVNEVIAKKLLDSDPFNQEEIDKLLIDLDGTPNKSKLGGNAILSVSQGICEAAASSLKMPNYLYVKKLFSSLSGQDFPLKIPTPTFNLINGGKHGAGNLEFQEFHIIPSSVNDYSKKLEMSTDIYQSTKEVLIRHGAVHSVGDEGGFAPNLFTNLDALEILAEAIKLSNFSFGKEVFFGLDIAASTFFKDGKYVIRDRTSPMESQDFIEFLFDLQIQYPLILLEDPLNENDWAGWIKITQAFSGKVNIIGDDFLCTNLERTKKAIEKKACSGILIKPNQAGTISETLKVIQTAREAGWKINVSHRSGETNDDFIADFAVGVGSDYCKFGAPARGERVAKYNRLLEIESELNKV